MKEEEPGEELVRNTDNYLSKIIVTKSYIEAKSDLDAAYEDSKRIKICTFSKDRQT